MQPISMALTDKEKVEKADFKPDATDIPDYPYGLRIILSQEEMRKIGSIRDQLDSEVRVSLVGKGKVVSTSSESVMGMTERSVTIQITDLALEIFEEGPSRADRLYGNSIVNG